MRKESFSFGAHMHTLENEKPLKIRQGFIARRLRTLCAAKQERFAALAFGQSEW